MMRRTNGIGLLLALLAIVAAWLVSSRVYEGVPHLEDEVAYVWQAQVFASGHITLPAVEFDQEFLVPFVVTHNGVRFGKYPPGWPLVLALGVLTGMRSLVNPLLAGLSVWLTYCLGKRLFSPRVGLLAAALTLTSPFFLLNSASLLSHPLGLALALGFSLAWINAFDQNNSPRQKWLAVFAAAACLGFLALTRPMTAVGIALPYGLHAAWILLRGSRSDKVRVLVFGLTALLISSSLFGWQYLVTGDPLLNPYTLWWPYDIIGFGPGHGVNPSGHTLQSGIENTLFSLTVGWYDLFGWGSLSWILLPFGMWAARRNGPAWLSGAIYPALVFVYLAYWVGSWLYGPRYFYEGLAGLAIFTAAGAEWLAGWTAGLAPNPGLRARALGVTALLTGLIGFNLLFYLPVRLASMTDLYGINQGLLAPFQTSEAQKLTPALILVESPRWMGYAGLLELQSPDLSSPFIFAWSSGPVIDARMAARFKDQRRIFTYIAGQPESLKELILP